MVVRTALAAVLLAASSSALIAQEKPATDTAAPVDIVPQVKSRDLTGTFGGQRVAYTATVKENVLFSDDGTKPEAVIVTTSYVANPRDTSRPVFFLFNGGPGSGSVWSVIRRSTPETANQARASSMALATDSMEPMPSASVSLPWAS